MANAFSLGMLSPEGLQFLRVERIPVEKVPVDALSTVGHQDTAAMLSGILGRPVVMNRVTMALAPGDVVYVAQYKGPRLPEGTTVLPEGASFSWLEVQLMDRGGQ